MRDKPYEYFESGRSVYLPLERIDAVRPEGGDLVLEGRGRLCRTSEKPLFEQNVGVESHFWGKQFGSVYQEIAVRLEFLTPRSFRMRVSPHGADGAEHQLCRDRTPMTVGSSELRFVPEIHSVEGGWRIDTGAIRLELQRDPYCLRVTDQDDRPVARFGGPESSRFCQWDSIPTGFLFGADRSRAVETFTMRYDEKILGMGERFSGMNRRGETVDNYAEDGLGNASPRCYKPIPFLMSSCGYGLFFNTACPFRAWIGSQSCAEATFVFEEARLDYYFFYGPSLSDILGQYTELTGRSSLPPRWSFGFWISRNSFNTGEEALEVARRFRREGLPADVVHLDPPWMGIPDGPQCNFEFDVERFGDPQAIIRELRSLDLHLSLWQLPYISDDSTVYPEASQSGVLVETYAASDPPEKIGVIDFSDIKAVQWYQGKLERLLAMGADVIKVDFGESSPANTDYHGYSGHEMHNLYSLLYTKAAYDITKEVKGEKNAMVWARSAYAGSQRYPVHWSGDPDANWETLPFVLKGGLSLLLSGFSFWSCDLGGYLFDPSSELYIRWTQFGMFCSHVRAHGNTPREPWEFGSEAMENFRKYAELRYRLMPYIYTEAEHAAAVGLPLMRPLVLDFEDDPAVYSIEDQYLFGRSILVAPCLAEGARERLVYLPEGEWVDYWTDTVWKGPSRMPYPCPLDVLPLFVRRGALIPTEDGRVHADCTVERLGYHFYPASAAAGHEYETAFFDGTRRHAIRVVYRAEGITLSIPEAIPLEELVPHAAEGLAISVTRT